MWLLHVHLSWYTSHTPMGNSFRCHCRYLISVCVRVYVCVSVCVHIWAFLCCFTLSQPGMALLILPLTWLCLTLAEHFGKRCGFSPLLMFFKFILQCRCYIGMYDEWHQKFLGCLSQGGHDRPFPDFTSEPFPAGVLVDILGSNLRAASELERSPCHILITIYVGGLILQYKRTLYWQLLIWGGLRFYSGHFFNTNSLPREKKAGF